VPDTPGRNERGRFARRRFVAQQGIGDERHLREGECGEDPEYGTDRPDVGRKYLYAIDGSARRRDVDRGHVDDVRALSARRDAGDRLRRAQRISGAVSQASPALTEATLETFREMAAASISRRTIFMANCRERQKTPKD